MAWFEDLTECTYFDIRVETLLAVGWLEQGRAFPVGEVDHKVYAALKEYLVNPWQPAIFFGFHSCDLVTEPATHGSKNLFVPGAGVIYVCPELITHYMNVHSYKPPDVFCNAVLSCPKMKSRRYMRAILNNGGRSMLKALSDLAKRTQR
jgi:hypothetical protein